MIAKVSSLPNLLQRRFSKIIGIDLGTTNSAVAVVQNGQAKIIENEGGKKMIPSVVSVNSQGQLKVGFSAKRQALLYPENTFYATKRLIGSYYDDPLTQKAIKLLPYKTIKGQDGLACLQAAGINYTPTQISGFVLRELKRIAEAHLNQEVKKAVIAVPTHFDDAQRRATKEAAQLAGLEAVKILNEPIAAAKAYSLAFAKSSPSTIAVIDLGGGCFDVSILEYTQGRFGLKCSFGDSTLGGEDFDKALQDYLVIQFKQDKGIDLNNDKLAMQRLREAVEVAKKDLSINTTTKVFLPYIAANSAGAQHLKVEVSREMFELLTRGLVERIVKPCEQCLKELMISKHDIDEIILVGGMTKMPKVQECIKLIFGKKLRTSIRGDEVIALGAAMQAGDIDGETTSVVIQETEKQERLGIFNRIFKIFNR